MEKKGALRKLSKSQAEHYNDGDMLGRTKEEKKLIMIISFLEG